MKARESTKTPLTLEESKGRVASSNPANDGCFVTVMKQGMSSAEWLSSRRLTTPEDSGGSLYSYVNYP